jgi:hypothetical protein
MITKWKSFLQQNATAWKVSAAGKWQVLVHNNYHPHYTGLSLFWFHNDDRFPRVVTKICRQPELLSREFTNLSQAYSCAPGLVPRPLHVGLEGDFWLLWMEGVPGIPLAPQRRWKAPTLCSLVSMLSSLHNAFRHQVTVRDCRYQRTVTAPLDSLAQFGASLAIRELCGRVARQASPGWLDSQPVIPQHGDLFRSNVLISGDQWHVVDWESFGMLDLPGYDLITILCSLLFESGPLPEQWNPSLVRQIPALMKTYVWYLGIAPPDISILLPLALANWFHLQWCDGRKAFATRMYLFTQHYAENSIQWHSIFLGQDLSGSTNVEVGAP